ncbi:hypothetical protein Tco_1500935 [Tanacetum coccineum]
MKIGAILFDTPKARHTVAHVIKKDLKQNKDKNQFLHIGPGREGGWCFNRLGGKERSASARSDGRQQSSYEKEIEVQPREHRYRGTSSVEIGGYSESKDSEGADKTQKNQVSKLSISSRIKAGDKQRHKRRGWEMARKDNPPIHSDDSTMESNEAKGHLDFSSEAPVKVRSQMIPNYPLTHEDSSSGETIVGLIEARNPY